MVVDVLSLQMALPCHSLKAAPFKLSKETLLHVPVGTLVKAWLKLSTNDAPVTPPWE